MKTRMRSILTLVCALCLGAVAAPPLALAEGSGAIKQPLSGEARGFCEIGGGGPFLLAKSFVVLNKADGHVSAQIYLQGAPAGGRWGIEFDQRPLEGCTPAEGIITTDNRGIGNAHISEPILPGNTGAFVKLDPINDAASAKGIIADEGVTFR